MSKLICFLGLLAAGLAMGQDAEAGGVGEALKSWPEFGKLMAFVLGLQIILRGIAEGLTRFADYTETNLDNKAAAVLSEISWFLGSVIGKVGYGTPKLVLGEAAKPHPEKTVAVEAPKA